MTTRARSLSEWNGSEFSAPSFSSRSGPRFVAVVDWRANGGYLSIRAWGIAVTMAVYAWQEPGAPSTRLDPRPRRSAASLGHVRPSPALSPALCGCGPHVFHYRRHSTARGGCSVAVARARLDLRRTPRRSSASPRPRDQIVGTGSCSSWFSPGRRQNFAPDRDSLPSLSDSPSCSSACASGSTRDTPSTPLVTWGLASSRSSAVGGPGCS